LPYYCNNGDVITPYGIQLEQDSISMPLQISQNYRSGKVTLNEVGTPALRSGGAIIRSAFSVISPGTEGTKLKEARMSLLQKARARPDQVKQVFDVVRQQGLHAAYQKVLSRLEQLTPLGYSVAGTVVAVAEDVRDLAIGDRVAGGGAGYANHAEYNFIPRRLIVPLPDEVKSEHGAFTTIGSIAMHAYRQSEIKLGETALVIGLGLVGQLLVQILTAAGVLVTGLDLAADRCELARQSVNCVADNPTAKDWQRSLGAGADVVFITAGGSDNTLLELAAQHVRDRGLIVVVGKTALDLDYNIFFKKEIEVKFSRSYGPGRFDPRYEEKGEDYPLPYVRWTEERNMTSFVDLLARKRLNLTPLIDVMRPFESAVEVMDQLFERQITAVGVVFQYAAHLETPRATVRVAAIEPNSNQLRIGIIGAGNYAASMILPELKSTKDIVLAHVVTSTGLNAAGIAQRFQIPAHGTDAGEIFADSSISAVIIATRHSSHASLVAQALTAGKATFVEKPLAIDESGLALVRHAFRPTSKLMVGFNRRYAPIIQRAGQIMRNAGPLQIFYRVQAGRLDADAWQHKIEEGERFVGEAGHFFDVFQFLTNANPVSVYSARLHPVGAMREHNNNLAVTVTYSDGSVATLHYGTFSGDCLPKEFLEAHGGGHSVIMDNFASLQVFRGNQKPTIEKNFGGGKGQAAQMKEFGAFASGSRTAPVAFEKLIDTTRLTLAARQSAVEGRAIILE
jgi:predicted dehydrogenase/threonine dehydrogenase-like Zn-dependent dehydrogenase